MQKIWPYLWEFSKGAITRNFSFPPFAVRPEEDSKTAIASFSPFSFFWWIWATFRCFLAPKWNEISFLADMFRCLRKSGSATHYNDILLSLDWVISRYGHDWDLGKSLRFHNQLCTFKLNTFSPHLQVQILGVITPHEEELLLIYMVYPVSWRSTHFAFLKFFQLKIVVIP